MSTSVIHPGTTPQAGRPGRFLGLAAVGLAVVITLGFVFAVNQGDEPTVSGAQPAQPTVVDSWTANVEFLAEQHAMRQASRPTVNIERYKLEMAGFIGGEMTPSVNIERYKLERAGVIGVSPSPTFNIEGYRIEIAKAQRAQDISSQRYQELADWLAAQNNARGEGSLRQRLAHEFVEDSAAAGTLPGQEANPLEGRAE